MANEQKNDASLLVNEHAIANIVLVGPIGNGKSATGNSIAGNHVFVSKTHARGVTRECQSVIVKTPEGPELRVIDTPGLFDLTWSPDYISREIIRCLQQAEGGLHAVLLVLSVKNGVTKDEELILSTLKVLFGPKIVDYLIVVFAAGDVLEEDSLTIEEYLDGYPEPVQRILESCEQRKVVFDNRTKDEAKKTKQVQELLHLIDLVKKHNDYIPYTNAMYQKIKEETERYKKEQDDLDKKEHSKEEIEKMRKELQLVNEQNLKAMAEMMENDIRMVTEAQQKLLRRGGKAEYRVC